MTTCFSKVAYNCWNQMKDLLTVFLNRTILNLTNHLKNATLALRDAVKASRCNVKAKDTVRKNTIIFKMAKMHIPTLSILVFFTLFITYNTSWCKKQTTKFKGRNEDTKKKQTYSRNKWMSSLQNHGIKPCCYQLYSISTLQIVSFDIY